MSGTVIAIFIAPEDGVDMREIDEVLAIAGAGLEGDRYCNKQGSFNKKSDKEGVRQVTLINGLFFENSGFQYHESRRNIVTQGVELNWLIGKEFKIGEALFMGEKYCDPCERPNKLSGNPNSFKNSFHDRGGLVARIIKTGIIRKGDQIIPPAKGY